MASWKVRTLGFFLAILICCSPELLNAAGPQQSTDPSATQSPAQPEQTSAEPAQAGNATSDTVNSNNDQLPNAPSTSAPSASSQTSNSNAPATNNAQNQQPGEPAGTAAAQIGKLKGGPASKPAGAAIAPAKQHRVRSFLIKFGALAGAGVAAGTVYALSKGSPSRPPGAH